MMKPVELHVNNNRSDIQGYTSDDQNVPLSSAFEAQIKTNQAAWQFLTNLAPSYRRDSIWWVMSTKKQETQLKRLGILIASSEAGMKIPTLRKKLRFYRLRTTSAAQRAKTRSPCDLLIGSMSGWSPIWFSRCMFSQRGKYCVSVKFGAATRRENQPFVQSVAGIAFTECCRFLGNT